MAKETTDLKVRDERKTKSKTSDGVTQADTDSVDARPRTRRVQQRAEVTKAKIIQAATQLFAELGYGGVSIRDIENEAGVKRGIVNHHFGNKEKLWKTVLDYMFGLLSEYVDARAELLRDLSPGERGPYLIRSYVRFSAAHPELTRLMLHESKRSSPRLRYIVDNHSRPIMRQLRENLSEWVSDDSEGTDDFVFWYYTFLGASSLVYTMAPEAQALFGFDRHDQATVDRHANFVADFLLNRSKNE